jgi:hypothetical protein
MSPRLEDKRDNVSKEKFSSETSVYNKHTRRHIPEDDILHLLDQWYFVAVNHGQQELMTDDWYEQESVTTIYEMGKL